MANPPSTFSRNISNDIDTVAVDFKLHPIRSSSFQILVQDDTGALKSHPAGPARTYLGTLPGHSGALASALLKADGTLLCRISFESGVEWSSTGGSASVRGSRDWVPRWPTTYVAPGAGAGSIVYGAEVGVDLSYQEYVAANSSINGVVEMAEFSVMAANVPFVRDAAILHRIGKVVVRSSQSQDPYVAAQTDAGKLLAEVKNQWNNVLPVGTTHHLALVARPGVGGGLGYVGVIGTESCYSANGTDPNGDFSVIWRHEAGHNWGSNHYEGGGRPEGPTIMSDNQLSRFSSSELAKILAHRNTKTSILDNLGDYAFPLAPRANMDHAEFVMGNALTLDVLGNDSDSNGKDLHLLSLSSQSALGGKLRRTIDNGPGGKDMIIYTPPVGLASGTDHFAYRIQDSISKTATGYVIVQAHAFSDDLAFHWTLHDGIGSTALEATSNQNHGTINGGSTWVSTGGHKGGRGAISLDGIDAHVATAPLHLNTNTMTICGWVKRNGTQAEYVGLAFSRSETNIGAGLHLGTHNELRYTWEAGNNPSWRFDSKLTLPDATWTFCAVVVSPTQATLYMKPVQGSLQSATATGSFSSISFAHDFNFFLGYDSNNSTRHFKGDMEDFRVFRRALMAMEITSLANDLGTPSTPSPGIYGSKVANVAFSLSWMPVLASSVSYQVYLDTNYSLVKDATTTSSQYKGSSTSATFSLVGLPVGTWFWRVDASDGTTVMKGPTWYFNTVEESSDLVGWWKMNEGYGNIVEDSSKNSSNGSIVGTSWGRDMNSSGLVFDGKSKVTCDTGASLSGTVSFSVSAWVKLPTTHSAFATIIQQRSPSNNSTDGFNGEYQLNVNSAGKPSFMLFGDNGYQFDFVATKAINDNQWHHVVAIRDGTKGLIYIDGTIFGTASGTLRNLDSKIPMFMGYDGRDDNNYLNGSLFEVRVYSCVLSNVEIQALINHTVPFDSITELPSLVGWWKMNEGSGSFAIDSSSNNANGTIVGAVWGSSGGLLFNGNGKVACGTNASLDDTTPFSVCAWVKLPTSHSAAAIIIQQRGRPNSYTNGYNGQYQLKVNADGKPSFWIFGNGANQFNFVATKAINDDRWHHVLAIRDGMEGRIYVDGALSGSITGILRSLDAKIPVFMGLDERDNINFLNGLLYDARIYNQVLFNEEIQDLVSRAPNF